MSTYCTRDNSYVGSDIGTDSWSVSTYRMSMYATDNSCVDRLNTEGGRDPASLLTQTGEKRRERVMLAEKNEEKQESGGERQEQTLYSDSQWKR